MADRGPQLQWFLLLLACGPSAFSQTTRPATPDGETRVAADWPQGDLVSYPGAWSFHLGKSAIILVSDDQLRDLADPDRKVNLSLGPAPQELSLRQVCEQAKKAGHRTLIIAFDHFFAQYRPGQHKPRELMPDSAEYIERIGALSKFAEQYGLGLELSLLSPLEIGPAYAKETGESGIWMHYREGMRDPKSGRYSVQLWRQQTWANNKGPLSIKDAGVRVFAFRQHRLHGTPYMVVDPAGIVEISDTAHVEVWDNTVQPNQSMRVRVYGEGGPQGPDHVLVVQSYRTPEMDYFSDRALPYLTALMDRYVDAGVKLNALYSDEMHIQQDWGYHNHHDNGSFAVRYVTPGFCKRFASLYGPQYADFAKYLVYFTYGQEDTATDLSARADIMHVMGASPEAIRQTALMRAHYYRLLQDTVVDLFTQAKHRLERRIGHRLEARAHATWAESPTCDAWNVGQEPLARNQYEYTPNFVWSNTVQQAASACYDYFRWGDFLTGNGNDHAEGGWLDRDYFGLAIGCSTGILNEVPNSYAAHWGMPPAVSQRRQALVDVYGAAAQLPAAMVEEMQHRDVEVLMLYPLDLVAVDERFGSWTTQYGYANYVTPAKLLERGRVVNGAIEMAGRRFTTLVALYEPFPSEKLLQIMRELVESRGRVIWSGPPPVLLDEGKPALPAWRDLAGVEYTPAPNEGQIACGRQVVFEGPLKGLAPMPILADFTVDHVYAVMPRAGTTVVAKVKGDVVGTTRTLTKAGSFTFLGFRPRDDQSASLGYETRWWFEILSTLGAYPPTGRIAGVNDNTEFLSRTTPYLACRFPNGTTAIAPHLRDLEEGWPGGFARDAEKDRVVTAKLKLPSDRLALDDFNVNGHTVTYEGSHAVVFRTDAQGRLIAFAGTGSGGVTIDGKKTIFAAQPMALVAWAPVQADRRVPGGAALQAMVHGQGQVRIPMGDTTREVDLVMEGPLPGSRGATVPSKVEHGSLVFDAAAAGGRWLYFVPRTTSATQPR